MKVQVPSFLNKKVVAVFATAPLRARAASGGGADSATELEIVGAPFRRFRAISKQTLVTSPFPQSAENGSL